MTVKPLHRSVMRGDVYSEGGSYHVPFRDRTWLGTPVTGNPTDRTTLMRNTAAGQCRILTGFPHHECLCLGGHHIGVTWAAP